MRKKFLLFSFPFLLALPHVNSYAATTTKEVTEAAAAVTPEPVVGSIQEAMKEFKSLSNHEKKSRFKEMKKANRTFRAKTT